MCEECEFAVREIEIDPESAAMAAWQAAANAALEEVRKWRDLYMREHHLRERWRDLYMRERHIDANTTD